MSSFKGGKTLLAAALLIFLPCLALSQVFDFGVDVPSDISGTNYLSNQIVHHDSGVYSVSFNGAAEGLGMDVNIIAIAVLGNGDIIFSTDAPFTASSINFEPRDIVQWNGVEYSMYKSGSALGLSASANINALALSSSGLLLISFDVPETVSATTYEPMDIARVNGDNSLNMYIDGSVAGIPADANITGYHELCGSDSLFCFDAPVDLGGTTYIPGQIVRYNGSYSLFYGDAAFPDYAGMTGFYVIDDISASPSNNGPVCIGNQINFTANPSGGSSPYTFSWDFGDSVGSSSEENPSYTYTSTGNFSACVTVTDSNGCPSGNECTTAEVNSEPSSSPANDGPACPGVAVNFTANPSGGSFPYHFSWDFGDGIGTSSQENPSYTYALTNSYTVFLTITDGNGCQSTPKYTLVDIREKPTSSPTNDGPSCGVINFTANPSGGTPPYNFNWNFGDGVGTSTLSNPSYIYSAPNSYTVFLTVTDSAGCTGSPLWTLADKLPGPDANPLSEGPTCPGETLNFTANPSAGTPPYTFEWDFGDGSGVSTEQNPSYTYSSTGSYQICLKVDDSAGCSSGNRCIWIAVYNSPSVAPSADNGCVGSPIEFYANPSGGMNPRTYTWDFGDGMGTSSYQNPAYTYGAAGTYTACVGVTDAGGCTGNTECVNVTVALPPSASPLNDSPKCDGQPVNFSANVSGGIAPYWFSWDFGDAMGWSSMENPTYTYAGPGTYSATVEVGSLACGSAPAVTTVIIREAPWAGFMWTDNMDCSVNFLDNSFVAEPPAEFSWDFGDGTGFSTDQNPTYTYAYDNSYFVSLTVTDATGCSNTYSEWVVSSGCPVLPPPCCEVESLELAKNGYDIEINFEYSPGDALYFNAYRGELGTWYSHDIRIADDVCPGDGSGDMVITDSSSPLEDENGYYYLVVAGNGSCEAGYGTDTSSAERPASADNCGLTICP